MRTASAGQRTARSRRSSWRRPGPARLIPTHRGQGLPAAEVAALQTRSGSARNSSYFPLTPRSLEDFDWLAVLDTTGYERGRRTCPNPLSPFPLGEADTDAERGGSPLPAGSGADRLLSSGGRWWGVVKVVSGSLVGGGQPDEGVGITMSELTLPARGVEVGEGPGEWGLGGVEESGVEAVQSKSEEAMLAVPRPTSPWSRCSAEDLSRHLIAQTEHDQGRPSHPNQESLVVGEPNYLTCLPVPAVRLPVAEQGLDGATTAIQRRSDPSRQPDCSPRAVAPRDSGSSSPPSYTPATAPS